MSRLLETPIVGIRSIVLRNTLIVLDALYYSKDEDVVDHLVCFRILTV